MRMKKLSILLATLGAAFLLQKAANLSDDGEVATTVAAQMDRY